MSARTLLNTTLWTALITPFTADGDVDLTVLTRLLQAQAQAGNGVVLLGSTGEGNNLTDAQRKIILEHSCSLQLDLPIIVGVPGMQLEQTLEWLAYCETLPIDGYLMVTPYYAKPGLHGQINWFRQLLDAVSRPCMIYNIPGRTSCALHPDVLEHLAYHPNLWALKESSGDLAIFSYFVGRYPNIAVFSGDDPLFHQHVRAGAKGLVSVCGNAWPAAMARHVTECLQGNFSSATLISPLLKTLLDQGTNPLAIKRIMAQLGLTNHETVKAPLSMLDCQPIDHLYYQQQIEQWFLPEKKLVNC